MEGSSALIVLVFVVAIFSSFGSIKAPQAFAPDSASPNTIHTDVAVEKPAITFTSLATTEENPSPQITAFISRYRDSDEAAEISNSILRYSEEYDVNPKLVAALIARESKFNNRAISSSGAIGLGQLLPSTAKNLKVDDPYDIDQNVRGTVRYMKSMLDRFSGDAASAIAAYFEGPNAVMRQGGFSNKSKAYVEDILSIYKKI